MNPNSGLKASRQAISMIKSFEIRARIGRVSLEAFNDDGSDTWTIGWGRVNHPDGSTVQPGDTIDLATAEAYLQEDTGIAERAIKACVKTALTQGQFDALVVFAFNCGGGALAKSSIVREINRGALDRVPAAWMRYQYARNKTTGKMLQLDGLVRRRRAELGLWRQLEDPDREEAIAIVPGTVTDRRPGAVSEVLQKSWTVWGALLSFVGAIVQLAETAIAFALEAAAELTRLEPVKAAALSAGANLTSIGFALTAVGFVTVLGRRINAAAKGKEG